MRHDINKPGMSAERVAEFNRVLLRYKAGKASIEERAKAAEEWWKLHNNTEAKKNTRGLGGFEAKSGWLHNVIVTKHSDAMEAYPIPTFLPREPGDDAEAQILSKIVPVVMEQNSFEETYSDVMWQKRKTGTGIYMVTWDPEKLHGLGDVSIKNVDVLNVFWEPGQKDIQKSKYFFHTQWRDNDELEEEYPELKGKLTADSFRPTEFELEDAVDRNGKSIVVDVYYKRRENGRTVLHYCKYTGNQVLYTTEPMSGGEVIDKQIDGYKGREKAATRQADKAKEQEKEKLVPLGQQLAGQIEQRNAAMNIMPEMSGPSMPGMGQQREHYGLYDHGLYPFVFDPLFPIERCPCGYGDIDLAANNQEQADIMQTAFLKNVMAGAVPRFFVKSNGSINEEEMADLSRQFVHVDGNLGADAIRLMDYKPLPSNYVSVRNNIINELRETTGNTETATGSTTHGVTAASAIAALQEASGKGSKDNIRGSYRAYRRVVEMVVELIRQFYEIPRQFRITGMLGQQEFISYSNEGLIGKNIPGTEAMTQPVFDIKIIAQKRSAYDTISQNELALELRARGFFDPQQTDISLMCLEMMEFEGKDALIQKIRQQGTLWRQMSLWQELALTLAMKYGEEQLAAGLMAQITGDQAAMGMRMGGTVDLGGDMPEESGVTKKARERAQMAAVPR